MDAKKLKELSKIIDVCRKKGVDSLKMDGFELKLRSDVPLSNYKKKLKQPELIPVEGGFSEEDILMWSSGAVNG